MEMVQYEVICMDVEMLTWRTGIDRLDRTLREGLRDLFLDLARNTLWYRVQYPYGC